MILNIPYIVSSSPSAVKRSCTVARVRLLSRAATRLTFESTCLSIERVVKVGVKCAISLRTYSQMALENSVKRELPA